MRKIRLTRKNQSEVIKTTQETLKKGGLVVFPSDTIYVLLADSGNTHALDKLLEFKNRPSGKAISVFVANETMAKEYVVFNQNIKNIVKNLLPGPFTVVGPSRHRTDPRLEAENGTLAFRLPDYPLIKQLCQSLTFPVTATSANVSSHPPYYSAAALLTDLSQNKKKILDLVVDAGKLPYNKPSTVIDATTDQLKTLRLGELLPKTANTLISRSAKETKQLGRYLVKKFIFKNVSKPLVFLLEGPLGAGKTVLAKGLAKALKIKEVITSPTFNISNDYPVPHNILTKRPNMPTYFTHYDLYRLETKQDFAEIGLLSRLSTENVYAIEWPEKLPEEILKKLPKNSRIVYIRIKQTGLTEREISWS